MFIFLFVRLDSHVSHLCCFVSASSLLVFPFQTIKVGIYLPSVERRLNM